MAVNPAEAVIGPAFVTLGGVELGLTTEDGVTLSPEFEHIVLDGPQSIVKLRSHRKMVDLKVSLTFVQLTLEKWRLAWDMATAPSNGVVPLKWNSTPTERPLVLTMPGANGSTRVLTCTAVLDSAGELAFNNGEYTGAPITLQLIGDPVENSYGDIVETASSATVPAPSGYNKVVAGTPSALADEDTGVAIGAAVEVVFNVAIRPDQLTGGNFALKTSGGNTNVAASIAYGTTTGATDYTKVRITPAANLSNSTEYQVLVAGGIKSFDGASSTSWHSIQFTTAAP